MTNCSFQIKNHKFKLGTQLVEIYKNETLVGTIYSTEEGIKIVGRSLLENPEEKIKIERDKTPSIPAILIKLQ